MSVDAGERVGQGGVRCAVVARPLLLDCRAGGLATRGLGGGRAADGGCGERLAVVAVRMPRVRVVLIGEPLKGRTYPELATLLMSNESHMAEP
jgi:hypothetical protein